MKSHILNRISSLRSYLIPHPHSSLDTIMASTEEPQITLVQEDSFEMVEHSDAVEDQCQDAVPALTDTEKKVKELEKKLEEMNDKQKVGTELCVKLAMI